MINNNCYVRNKIGCHCNDSCEYAEVFDMLDEFDAKNAYVDDRKHEFASKILFCLESKKCDSSTEPIQPQPNNILK